MYRLTPGAVRKLLRKPVFDGSIQPEELPKGIRKFAEVIGVEKALALSESMSTQGCAFEIPSNTRLYLYLRNCDIHEDFYGCGKSAAQIAAERDMSERRVQQILSQRFEDLKPRSGEAEA